MERRLAAILIADVVGYSRLSQIDEEGTRARFQADQDNVFEPAIERHHGRLVKTMNVDTDDEGAITRIHSVRQLPLSRCRSDRAIGWFLHKDQ